MSFRLGSLIKQGGDERGGTGVIAEGPAHVGKSVHITWAEDETSAKLKRIAARTMLAVAGRAGTLPGGLVVSPQQMQNVGLAQAGGTVSQPLLVYEKRESDAGLLPKEPRVSAIAEAHGSHAGSPIFERLFVFAQLRDMLAAEESAVVPQENEDGRLPLPKRSEADFPAVDVRQGYGRECFTERAGHQGAATVTLKVARAMV